jgi:Lon-like ATP-dependent protease
MPKKKEKGAVASFSSTEKMKIPKQLAEQVVGQERAVEIIKKAASQRRNVLLVGLPGTGKSMLAQAMAELLPLQKLRDTLVYPNLLDSNNPKITEIAAGRGAKIIEKAKLDVKQQEDSTRLLGILVPLGWFIITYVLYAFFGMHVNIYAATIVVGGFLLVAFTVGSQMKMKSGTGMPKLLVDNSGKKVAPFIDATGARAGALLGDVRHDPLQSHYGFNKLYVQKGDEFVGRPFAELWEDMSSKYKDRIETNDKGYEALMLPDKEKIYTLGHKSGKVILSRILSLNRRPFEGELIDITSEGRTVSLTPEHKIDISGAEKEASQISSGDRIFKLSK